MNTAVKNRVKVRIFVGFELKIDLKMALAKNSSWNEASVSKTTCLREIHYQEKDYIGIHLEHDTITMKHLQEHAAIVRKELEKFCPKYNTISLKVNIFPQVFVA